MQHLFDWLADRLWAMSLVRRWWVRQANHGWAGLVRGCALRACSCNDAEAP